MRIYATSMGKNNPLAASGAGRDTATRPVAKARGFDKDTMSVRVLAGEKGGRMAKANQSGAAYTVANKETIAKVPGLQAVGFTMDPGESTPWHYHSVVTDIFFCLAGPMEVHLQGPSEVVTLACGERYDVAPERVHRAVNSGAGAVRYLLLQGVGQYDFIAAPGDAV